MKNVLYFLIHLYIVCHSTKNNSLLSKMYKKVPRIIIIINNISYKKLDIYLFNNIMDK